MGSLLEEGDVLSESEEPGAVGTPSDAAASQPLAVGASAMPAAGGSAGWRGPLGKPRGVLFVILLSIFTLGIYHLYWVFKVFEELKQHTGNGIGGVLGLVIALVIGVVNFFVLPSEIGNLYRGDGQTAPMSGWAGLWILLPIVGWFVWVVKVQRALNHYWESKGATA
jgi:hypothetical protein